MHWAHVLPLDQPMTMPNDAVQQAAQEFYRPLLRTLRAAPNLALTLSISGALSERLDHLGLSDVIDGLRALAERGQIELAGTAMFRPLLPLLPLDEAARQIRLNNETNRRIFGEVYRPQGFVPPELAVTYELCQLVRDQGFAWMLCDELARGRRTSAVDPTAVYEAEGLAGFQVYFRNRALSAPLADGAATDAAGFLAALAALPPRGYAITAAAGEPRAGHPAGQAALLEEIARQGAPSTCRISDLPEVAERRLTVRPAASSAAVSTGELAEGVPFAPWDDPTNELQGFLWQLTRLAAGAVKEAPGNDQARQFLDEALDSRPLLYAGCRPHWDPAVVMEGARRLISAVVALGTHGPEWAPGQAHAAYREIRRTAEDWQSSGYARQRITHYLAAHPEAREEERPGTLP